MVVVVDSGMPDSSWYPGGGMEEGEGVNEERKGGKERRRRGGREQRRRGGREELISKCSSIPSIINSQCSPPMAPGVSPTEGM